MMRWYWYMLIAGLAFVGICVLGYMSDKKMKVGDAMQKARDAKAAKAAATADVDNLNAKDNGDSPTD